MASESWKPDLYVLARLFEALSRNGPAKRTAVQMAAGINYPTFQRYFRWMKEHGLVDESEGEDGNSLVCLSVKGRQCRSRFVEWLEEVFEESVLSFPS
jgi:predicted transcriptional regulator